MRVLTVYSLITAITIVNATPVPRNVVDLKQVENGLRDGVSTIKRKGNDALEWTQNTANYAQKEATRFAMTKVDETMDDVNDLVRKGRENPLSAAGALYGGAVGLAVAGPAGAHFGYVEGGKAGGAFGDRLRQIGSKYYPTKWLKSKGSNDLPAQRSTGSFPWSSKSAQHLERRNSIDLDELRKLYQGHVSTLRKTVQDTANNLQRDASNVGEYIQNRARQPNLLANDIQNTAGQAMENINYNLQDGRINPGTLAGATVGALAGGAAGTVVAGPPGTYALGTIAAYQGAQRGDEAWKAGVRNVKGLMGGSVKRPSLRQLANPF